MGHVTGTSDAYDIALRVGHAKLRHTKRCSAQNVIFSNFSSFKCQKHVFVIRKIKKFMEVQIYARRMHTPSFIWIGHGLGLQ